MSEPNRIKIPSIDDTDIERVIIHLGLEPLDTSRRQFLKSVSTLDVSACPGSGKTTLIVAKLALLAEKWESRTRGICVLSHTNVAREEIERRLGHTPAGQKLLSYPHFIGTIHGFVNQFLAMPWLRSNGFPIVAIDNDITEQFRKKFLGRKWQGIQDFLSKKNKDFSGLRIVSSDFDFVVSGEPYPSGETAKTYIAAKSAVKASAEAGYFCHDEMFVWAETLLDECPSAATALRARFPLILLDEMQDTSEEQSRLLDNIFPRSNDDLVVQRVGDPNQAIFNSLSDQAETQTDPFPDTDPSRFLSIPNSFRFGHAVANFAAPLALIPVTPSGLCGVGPKHFIDLDMTEKNAIFLFSDDQAGHVISVYGQYLLELFPDTVIEQGNFVAVGAVHNNRWPTIGPGHKHHPKGVWHYWSGYAPSASRSDVPRTFVEYVIVTQAKAQDGAAVGDGVIRIAEGMFRLVNQIGDTVPIMRKTNKHRAIVAHLQDNIDCLTTYREFLRRFVVMREPITETLWSSISPDLIKVATALCQKDTVQPERGEEFLSWPTNVPVVTPSADGREKKTAPNVYPVTDGERTVNVQIGSIHSVKGQTHTSTLVLDTHRYDHAFEKLMPWLSGQRSAGSSVKTRDKNRLLQTYVAMTRPSHLICLAICEHSLGEGDVAATNISNLQRQGWRVGIIIGGKLQWK